MKFEIYNSLTKERLETFQTQLNEIVTYYNNFLIIGGYTKAMTKAEFATKGELARRAYENKEHNKDKKNKTDKNDPLVDFLNLRRKEIEWYQYLEINNELRPAKHWAIWASSQPKPIQDQIKELETQWVRHSNFSHLNAKKLIELSHIVDTVDDEIQQSLKRIARIRDNKDAQAYATYLKKLSVQVLRAQHQIAESFFYRLKMAYANQSLWAHHPVSPLIAQFDTWGILLKSRPQPHIPNQFLKQTTDPYPWAHAHAYIKRCGTKVIIATAQPYFQLNKGQKTLNLVSIQHANTYLMVPETMSTLIPYALNPITRRMPGYRLRYDFFDERAPLLFQLASLTPPLKPQWVQDDTYFKQLEALQDTLQQDFQDAQDEKTKGFRLFRQTTFAFLTQWQREIMSQQQEITAKQINYLEALAIAPLPFEALILESTQAMVWQETLKSYLNQVEARVNAPLIAKEDKERFKRVKKRLLARWKVDEKAFEMSAEERSLQQLAQGKPLSLVQFKAFKESLKETPLDTLKINVQHYAIYWAHLIKHSQFTLQKMADDLAALTPLKSTLDYFNQATKLLAYFASPLNQQFQNFGSLEATLKHLMTHYQAYIHTQKTTELRAQKDTLIALEWGLFSLRACFKSHPGFNLWTIILIIAIFIQVSLLTVSPS